ncbi:MAG: DnaA/Hda family protein [Pirellulales bacterium]|nr:DnaA/Hda family protein [Pirellulales bacterium]
MASGTAAPRVISFLFPEADLAGRRKPLLPSPSGTDNKKQSRNGRSQSEARQSQCDRAYLIGPENHLVPVLIDDFLQSQPRFSPVVVYGPVGSGKTHLAELLLAMGNSRNHAPDASVKIARATDLISSARGPGAQSSALDVADENAVIFLDVCDLARHPRAQERLVTLLDEWRSTGRHVLLTSRTHPGEIKSLDARLRSRLQAGLCVRLELPREETRRALFVQWAKLGQMKITSAALDVLAKETEGTPARLRGVLAQFALACAPSTGDQTQLPRAKSPRSNQSGHQPKGGCPARLDADDARKFLGRESGDQSKLGIPLIAKTTARHFGVTLSDLRGPSRRKSTALARSVAMYLARTLAAKNLTEIGRWFNGRDHTTVLHSCRKIESEKNHEHAIAEAVGQLSEILEVRF